MDFSPYPQPQPQQLLLFDFVIAGPRQLAYPRAPGLYKAELFSGLKGLFPLHFWLRHNATHSTHGEDRGREREGREERKIVSRRHCQESEGEALPVIVAVENPKGEVLAGRDGDRRGPNRIANHDSSPTLTASTIGLRQSRTVGRASKSRHHRQSQEEDRGRE
ncbi:hypothetical protein TIFTF001_054067 [Ficus carica]|uniref:Uncharacterized protein n=1 Tax=Ficus carica TaxID=3494 RepID=A0AA88EAS4_FICCA|nr:hypothetical protein TIFTF001_054067 [Ficus carica]